MVKNEPILAPIIDAGIINNKGFKNNPLKFSVIENVIRLVPCEKKIIIREINDALFISNENNMINILTFTGPPPIDKNELIIAKKNPVIKRFLLFELILKNIESCLENIAINNKSIIIIDWKFSTNTWLFILFINKSNIWLPIIPPAIEPIIIGL